jgi:NTP pyrophosphatase (non-canonical NTP hydrolase)
MQLSELIAFIDTIIPVVYKHHHDDDIDKSKLLHLAKLTEEVGELAEQVLGSCNAQRASKSEKISPENLAKECCDVIITTLVLMQSQAIDVEKVLTERMLVIQERMGI